MKSKVSEIDIEIGAKLREMRKEKGLSQNDLASLIGVTFQQIQKYEKGQNRISASKLFVIAHVLSIEIDWFFEDLLKDQSTPVTECLEKTRKNYYAILDSHGNHT